MEMSIIESETKVRVPDREDLENKLVNLGAVQIGSVQEEDMYFTSRHRDLRARNEILRVRTRRHRDSNRTECLLTFKTGLSAEIKQREELEITISDDKQAKSILEGLGFDGYVLVQKERKYFTFRGFALTIDNVTGLGAFLELEALSETPEESVQGRLLAVLKEIGIPRGLIEAKTYSEMMFEKQTKERLANVANKLNSAEVKWAVFGGAAVFASVPSRMLTDIDVIVKGDDVAKAERALEVRRQVVRHKYGSSFGIFLSGVDIVDKLQLEYCTSQYSFRMDERMEERIAAKELFGMKIPCIADEDIIVLKVILQRGPEEGKRDIDDIRDLLKTGKIDMIYLRERLQTFRAVERAMYLERRWGIDLQA